MFAVMPEAVPHVQSGKLFALGLMSPTRSPVFPQVPTMAESGIADMKLSARMALLAPAKTPPPHHRSAQPRCVSGLRWRA